MNELLEQLLPSLGSGRLPSRADSGFLPSSEDMPNPKGEGMSFSKQNEGYAVLSWLPSYGELKIVNMKTGKRYVFIGVTPGALEKVRKYERVKAYGKGWQILKQFERGT